MSAAIATGEVLSSGGTPRGGDEMEHYVVAAPLKKRKAAQAERELEQGPPFDPGTAGLSEHGAYLTDRHVYLVFDGDAAHTKALQLARTHLAEITRWQELVSGLPSRVKEVPPKARCIYRWRSSDDVE
jgi:hypothetical protein